MSELQISDFTLLFPRWTLKPSLFKNLELLIDLWFSPFLLFLVLLFLTQYWNAHNIRIICQLLEGGDKIPVK